MSEERMRSLFHRAIDASLSGLKEENALDQRLLYRIHREEHAPMKRKITAAVVLAAVLILAMAAALAVGLYREYFEKIG